MSQTPKAEVVVAGHICLDIIPTLPNQPGGLDQLLCPGKLTNIGPAVVATGGTVANTGLALHRLGVRTRLVAKIGDDVLGHAVQDVLAQIAPELAHGLVVASGETTSYTVVLNPPGVDRMFLHCPGANDTFVAGDLEVTQFAGARLFHFGYPPLMRRMFLDGGRELDTLLSRVKQQGLQISLDMSLPDPDSESGKVDWHALMKRVLPHVDVFLPSLDEMRFMLKRTGPSDGRQLREIANELLQMGAKIVGLKLGDQGFYLRTAERELLAACFSVNVTGTTGSGDCTIAGFLAGLMRDQPLEAALVSAVAAGACCCEQPDATSGVTNWAALQQRIAAGWARRAVTMALPDWRHDERTGLWIGPNDHTTD